MTLMDIAKIMKEVDVGNDRSMIGDPGPRQAGLNMQVDSYTGDDVTTDIRKGDLWNVGNASMIQIPTDQYMEDFTQGRRMPSEETYTKEYAQDHGLGLYDRLKLFNTASRIDYPRLRKEEMEQDSVKGYAASNRSGTKKVALNKNNTQSDNVNTLPHELNHVIQLGYDQLSYFDKDYRRDSNLPYRERGFEAIARLGGNKGMFPEDLLSTKSKYGVHPLIDVDTNGNFNANNGYDYLYALVRTGRISKEKGLEMYHNLEKESNRLNDMYKNDAEFQLKINQARLAPDGTPVRYALGDKDYKIRERLHEGVSEDRMIRGDVDIERQFMEELGLRQKDTR